MGILVSPQHGVNPVLSLCFLCMGAAEVVLLGRLSREKASQMFGKEVAKYLEGSDQDVKAPREALFNTSTVCDQCKSYMDQGVILISVDPTKTTDMRNPYRSGGWLVMREEAVVRMLREGELLDSILEHRVAFVDDETWDGLGLPRGNTDATRDT